MAKWSYKIVPMEGSVHTQDIQINNIGIEEWELIGINNGYFYFKKPGNNKKRREIPRSWEYGD